MASIVWSDVTGFAPSLSTTPVDAQTAILAYVNTILNVSNFHTGEDDPSLRLARIYLAAHFGTLALQAGIGGGVGVGGPVTQESVGGISRSYGYPYASAGGGSSPYDSTAYGRMYLMLIRQTGARIPVVL